ncbi:MAG TPA: TetR/AcrR family transcriptional regulator [Thermoanaerobaculia bacterium]
MTETREQLLDTAERLFAERGVDTVSLRDITSAAGANVASVNYHFGSKEKLVSEVFRRRLQPINDERLDLLTRFEQQSGGTANIEQIMFAFVHPVIRRMSAEPESGANLMRLMSHVHSDVNASLAGIVLHDMQDMIERFMTAAQQAMPSLPKDEIYWRAHFATGVMAHTAAAAGLLHALSDGACDVSCGEDLSCRLVAFISGGFHAEIASARAAIGKIPEVKQP